MGGVLFNKNKTTLIQYPAGKKSTEYIIPETVTTIKEGAFSECDLITSLTITNSVTSIGEYAFEGCTGLKNLTIGEGITELDSDWFENCASIETLRLGNNISGLTSDTFSDFNLHSIFVSSSNPFYSVQDGVLFNKDKTTLIMYLHTKKDSHYVVPDTVTNIADGAFVNCESLTSITIPDSVTSIGDEAFSDCSALKYVFYTGSSSEWKNISIGNLNSSLTSAKIHYNSTDHNHSVTKQIPLYIGMEGYIEDVCSVCGYEHRSDKLVYGSDYFAGVESKFVSVDEENGFITIDASLVQDINDVIVLSDGYQIGLVPSLETGFYGTGSVINVFDSDWNFIRSYVLAVQGDVNGDSVCDVIDCMLIELARTNNRNLDGVYLSAGDLAGNGVIDDDDFNAIVNKAIA